MKAFSLELQMVLFVSKPVDQSLFVSCQGTTLVIQFGAKKTTVWGSFWEIVFWRLRLNVLCKTVSTIYAPTFVGIFL